MDALDRMRGAAFDARQRLDSVTWHMDPSTFYGPLSETLVWITAVADGMGLLEESRFSGLAYARNCTLHGRQIVTAVHTQEPGTWSALKGDNARLAAGPVRVWQFTEDPEPHDPSSGKERNAKRRRDFNNEVAQHAVFPMLDARLLDLGVNIWDRDTELAARPASRRKVIPPGWILQD